MKIVYKIFDPYLEGLEGYFYIAINILSDIKKFNIPLAPHQVKNSLMPFDLNCTTLQSHGRWHDNLRVVQLKEKSITQFLPTRDRNLIYRVNYRI